MQSGPFWVIHVCFNRLDIELAGLSTPFPNQAHQSVLRRTSTMTWSSIIRTLTSTLRHFWCDGQVGWDQGDRGTLPPLTCITMCVACYLVLVLTPAPSDFDQADQHIVPTHQEQPGHNWGIRSGQDSARGACLPVPHTAEQPSVFVIY